MAKAEAKRNHHITQTSLIPSRPVSTCAKPFGSKAESISPQHRSEYYFHSIYFPLYTFIAGHEFLLHILIGVDRFHISMNNIHFCDYLYRTGLNRVSYVQVRSCVFNCIYYGFALIRNVQLHMYRKLNFGFSQNLYLFTAQSSGVARHWGNQADWSQTHLPSSSSASSWFRECLIFQWHSDVPDPRRCISPES